MGLPKSLLSMSLNFYCVIDTAEKKYKWFISTKSKPNSKMLLICQSGINVGKFSEKSSQDFRPYYYGKKTLNR